MILGKAPTPQPRFAGEPASPTPNAFVGAFPRRASTTNAVAAGVPRSTTASLSAAVAPTDSFSPLEEVKRILRDIRKVMKTKQLYAHVEDHGHDQLRAIYARLEAMLQIIGELSLRVDVSSLIWNDVEVFSDESHDLNFGYSLYRAGVRLLAFRSGLEWEEFVQFWAHVSGDIGYHGDEDLLTRLWRDGYEHIAWIALTQLIEDDATELAYKSVGADALNRFSPEALKEHHGDALAALHRSFITQAAHGGWSDHGDDEQAVLRILEEERARIASAVAEALLDMARIDSFPEVDGYQIATFERLAEQLLWKGQGMALASLCERAYAFLSREQRPAQRQSLTNAVAGLGRALRAPTSFDLLRTLVMAPGFSATAYGSIVRLLVGDGTNVLLSLLDGALRPEFRSITLRGLALTPAAEVPALARRVRSAEERQACDLLDVIALLDMPRKTTLCEPALSSSLRVVRTKAMQVIGRCNEPANAGLIIGRHLERCADASERVEAIQILGKLECAEADRALLGYIAKDNCPPTEIARAWEALLSHPSETAFAEAEQVASSSTRGVFGAARSEAQKAGLVEALGLLADVRAARLLNVICADEGRSSKAVYRRARDLLDAIRARLDATNGGKP